MSWAPVVEHRLAQFRGPPDGFIDGIQTGNAAEKMSFRLARLMA